MAATPPPPSSPEREPDGPGGAGGGAPTKICPTCNESYPADYAVCPRDTTPLMSSSGAQDPLLGQVLGDTYELLRLLGEGGMGRVYEARQVRLGNRFAVKVLHHHFASDLESVARFRREATAASTIHSPHVAQVVDVNVGRDGRPYIVQELLEGRDLGYVLEEEGTLSIGRAVGLMRQVCRALAAAHAAGIVHRDLKPENIMVVRVDGQEMVKVLDFGIAKTVVGAATLTRTGIIMGTPAYMAPEQARGSHDVDYRVDVYAVGAILYRSLTGRPAFSDSNPTTVITKLLSEEPERPKTLRRDLPDDLELVIQRAMAKSVEERIPSMAALDEALEPFAEAGAPSSPPLATPAPATSARELGRAETVALKGASTTNRIEDRPVRRVRARAVRDSLAVFLWGVLAIASLGAWGIRGVVDRTLSPAESLLATVAALGVMLPMGIVWVRHLAHGTWRNTASMVGRAESLSQLLWMSLGGYAVVRAVGGATYVIALGRAEPSWIEAAAWIAALGGPFLTVLWQRRSR